MDPGHPSHSILAIDARNSADLGVSIDLRAVAHLLRGRAHEGLENRTRAAECYRQALEVDPYCYDAFR